MSLASWWKKTGLYAVIKHGIKGITLNGEPLFQSISSQIDDDTKDVINDNLTSVLGSALGLTMSGADRDKLYAQTEAQRYLSDKDYERKIDFYENYESPQAMMRQYKDAGLNPALMYEGIGNVSASGGVGAGSPGSVGSSLGILAMLPQLLNIGVQRQLRQQEINNDFELRSRELGIEQFKAQQQASYWNWLGQESQSRTLLNGATMENVLANAEARRILNWYLPQQQETALREAGSRISEIEEKVLLHQKERALMEEQMNKIAAEIRVLNSQENLNTALASQALQNIAVAKKQVELLGKQIGLTDKDIEFYGFNHAKSASVTMSGSGPLGIGGSATLSGSITPGQQFVSPFGTLPPFIVSYLRKMGYISSYSATE